MKDCVQSQKEKLLDQIGELYRLIKVIFDKPPLESFDSYGMIHKIELSNGQEYEILQTTCEKDHLLFISANLLATIAV